MTTKPRVRKPNLPEQAPPPTEEFAPATATTAVYREMVTHNVGRYSEDCACGFRYFTVPSYFEQIEHIATALLGRFTITPKEVS